MLKKSWRWTSVLIFSLILFLAGLGFARLQLCGQILFGISLVSVVFLFFVRQRQPKLFYIALIIFGFVAGWFQGSLFMQKVAVYDSMFGQQVTLEVTALEDSTYNEKSQMEFTAHKIVVISHGKNLPGQIVVNGFGVPMVYKSDRLKLEGKLFPRRGANQASMGFAQISLLERNPSPIDRLRRNFAAGIQNTLPEPLASFGLGLLIGQRATLGKTVTDELTTSGLIHIVAVSGYNLTVIIMICRRLSEKRSRYQAFLTSLLLIGIFLLLTGNSPSIVRAAVVSALGLFTWYFGRRIRPVLLLLISAALTAGVNPLYLWSNIGWHLSFTAFFGVLVLAPLLVARLKKSSRENLLVNVLTETTAAQICTLPILLFIFGRLSIVSIVANLLVVPFVPLAMLLSLLAGLAGMTQFVLSGLVAIPARLVLRYMLDVSALLSRVPLASVQVQITAGQMIGLYIVILLFTVSLWFKNKSKAAKITGKKTGDSNVWTQQVGNHQTTERRQ